MWCPASRVRLTNLPQMSQLSLSTKPLLDIPPTLPFPRLVTGVGGIREPGPGLVPKRMFFDDAWGRVRLFILPSLAEVIRTLLCTTDTDHRSIPGNHHVYSLLAHPSATPFGSLRANHQHGCISVEGQEPGLEVESPSEYAGSQHSLRSTNLPGDNPGFWNNDEQTKPSYMIRHPRQPLSYVGL